MPGPLQSIERAAAVLELLASAPSPLGVTEVAESLGLAKSTAHGIVRTLRDVGLVDQDPGTGRYRVGRAAADLGSVRLDEHRLRGLAANWLDALAVRVRESVRLVVPLQGRAVVVHHVFRPDDSAQVLDVGAVRPAHACAMGKVLLANGAVLDRDLTAWTWRTITDPGQLDGELAATRHRGWASEVGEYRLAEAGVAMPVRDRGGRVVAAAGVTGRPDRLVDRDGRPGRSLLQSLHDCVRAVSRELATTWGPS